MSNDTLSEAQFLPSGPPITAINDYSHTLSGAEIGSLTAQASALTYKVTVVVFPKDFSPSAFDEFALALARKWGVSGREVLLVVDLKSHKVLAVGGHQLNASGISSEYLQQIILQREFIPYVANDDLSGAISHTLSAVDRTLAQSTAHGGIHLPWPPASTPVVFCVLAAALAMVIVISVLDWRKRTKTRRKPDGQAEDL